MWIFLLMANFRACLIFLTHTLFETYEQTDKQTQKLKQSFRFNVQVYVSLNDHSLPNCKNQNTSRMFRFACFETRSNFSPFCTRSIQSWTFALIRLQNKSLTVQILPLKCCQPLELLTNLKRVQIFQYWKYGVCRLKGCKVADHQTLRMIRTWVNSNSGRTHLNTIWLERLKWQTFLQNSNFDRQQL